MTQLQRCDRCVIGKQQTRQMWNFWTGTLVSRMTAHAGRPRCLPAMSWEDQVFQSAAVCLDRPILPTSPDQGSRQISYQVRRSLQTDATVTPALYIMSCTELITSLTVNLDGTYGRKPRSPDTYNSSYCISYICIIYFRSRGGTGLISREIFTDLGCL